MQLLTQLKVIPGDSSQSYGIEVFELVPGLPLEVIQRAYEIRSSLLLNPQSADPQILEFKQLIGTSKQNKELQNLKHFIKSINVDEVTPKEALQLLYLIQDKAENKE